METKGLLQGHAGCSILGSVCDLIMRSGEAAWRTPEGWQAGRRDLS